MKYKIVLTKTLENNFTLTLNTSMQYLSAFSYFALLRNFCVNAA